MFGQLADTSRKGDTMKRKREIQEVGRRDMLRLAGLGGVAGAAAVAGAAGGSRAARAAESKGSGYRETEHVRTYYELAKF